MPGTRVGWIGSHEQGRINNDRASVLYKSPVLCRAVLCCAIHRGIKPSHASLLSRGSACAGRSAGSNVTLPLAAAALVDLLDLFPGPARDGAEVLHLLDVLFGFEVAYRFFFLLFFFSFLLVLLLDGDLAAPAPQAAGARVPAVAARAGAGAGRAADGEHGALEEVALALGEQHRGAVGRERVGGAGRVLGGRFGRGHALVEVQAERGAADEPYVGREGRAGGRGREDFDRVMRRASGGLGRGYRPGGAGGAGLGMRVMMMRHGTDGR